MTPYGGFRKVRMGQMAELSREELSAGRPPVDAARVGRVGGHGNVTQLLICGIGTLMP